MTTNALPSSQLPDQLPPEQPMQPATYQLLAGQKSSPVFDRSQQIQSLADKTIKSLRKARDFSRANYKSYGELLSAAGVIGIVLMALLLSKAMLGWIAVPIVVFLIACYLLYSRPNKFSEKEVEQVQKLFEDLQDPNQNELELCNRCYALGINYQHLGLRELDPFQYPIMCERIKREAEADLGKVAVKYSYAKLCEHIPEIKLLRAKLALEILDQNKPLQPIVDKHTMDGLKALDLLSVRELRYKQDRPLLDAYVSPSGTMTEAEFATLVSQMPQLKDHSVDRLRKLIQDPKTPILEILKKHTLAGLIKLGLKDELVARYKIEAPKMNLGEIANQVGLKFVQEHNLLTQEQRLQKWEQWKSNPFIRDEWFPKPREGIYQEDLLSYGFITAAESREYVAAYEQLKKLRADKDVDWIVYFRAKEEFYKKFGIQMSPWVRVEFREQIRNMRFTDFMEKFADTTNGKMSEIFKLADQNNHPVSPVITAEEYVQLSAWEARYRSAPEKEKIFVAAEINKEFQEQFVKVFDQPSAPFEWQRHLEVD